jgi:hypothetical protein
MSCSRTGTSICSRSGSSRTVTWNPPSPTSSHAGLSAVEGVDVVADHDHLLWTCPQLDDIALADPVAGDVHPAAVDVDVAVAHELAGLGTGGRPTGAEHDVVESLLEHAEQVLAGHALLAGGLLVEVAELTLETPVGERAFCFSCSCRRYSEGCRRRVRPCSPGG